MAELSSGKSMGNLFAVARVDVSIIRVDCSWFSYGKQQISGFYDLFLLMLL